MASKKVRGSGSDSRPGTGGSGKWGNLRFINVSLTDAQKSAYAAWLQGRNDIEELEDYVLQAGYKLSSGFDENTSSVICTLTNRKGDPAFVDCCYSLRARTAWEARARVLWLHAVFGEGDWNAFATPDVDVDIW